MLLNYGDVIISDLNEFLDTFLESAGKIDEINKIDEKITNIQNKLSTLESKKIVLLKNMRDSDADLSSKEENRLEELETQISIKTADISKLIHKKDEIIKKCLMKQHAQMKKDYQQVNEDHEKYVELYTQARERKHFIERNMMYLKSLFYKNYKIRLN